MKNVALLVSKRELLKCFLLLFVGYQFGYFVSSIMIPKDIHTQNILTRIGDDIQNYYGQNGCLPPTLSCLSDSGNYGMDAWGNDIHYTLLNEESAILSSSGKRIDNRIQYNLVLHVSVKGLKNAEKLATSRLTKSSGRTP